MSLKKIEFLIWISSLAVLFIVFVAPFVIWIAVFLASGKVAVDFVDIFITKRSRHV